MYHKLNADMLDNGSCLGLAVQLMGLGLWAKIKVE